MKMEKLLAKFHIDQLSKEESSELESGLRDCEANRQRFHRSCRIDAFLRRESENASFNMETPLIAGEDEGTPLVPEIGFLSKPLIKPLATAAALVLLSALTWTIAEQTRIIATLTSVEDAVWEEGVVMDAGESLTKGSLRLTSGIARIELRSGTEITLEGPARLYLKGESRASLASGTVAIKTDQDNVFLLETKFGQAVSRKAEFAAFSMPRESKVSFESISGKVTISHDVSREVTQLSYGGFATMFAERLISTERGKVAPPFERDEHTALIRTGGREATFIRNNSVQKWTRPELLTLKTSREGNGFDQRVVVSFDFSNLSREEIKSVSMKLSLVHSAHGLLSRLPKTNRFSLYGLTNPEKENWSTNDLWEEAPNPDDGVLLAQFEIPRSRTDGKIELAEEDLLNFVRNQSGTQATFILVRDTANLEGQGPGYTHAVASGSHPEIPGPTLEISLR